MCGLDRIARDAVDRSRDLSLATIDKAAETLATDILTSPQFAQWRDRYFADFPSAREFGIGVLVVDFENKTSETNWNIKIEEYCHDLSRHLLKGQVYLSYRSGDETAGGFDPSKRQLYVEALSDFNRMDQYRYYNQESGRQSQGGFEKPVLGLKLRVVSDDHGGTRDFVMRAMLIDGRTKREVVSERIAPLTG